MEQTINQVTQNVDDSAPVSGVSGSAKFSSTVKYVVAGAVVLIVAVAGYLASVSNKSTELKSTSTRASVNTSSTDLACEAIVVIPTPDTTLITPSITPPLPITPTPFPPSPTPTGIVSCNKHLDIAFVLDRSYSMTEKFMDIKKIQWAREAAISAIQSIPTGADVNVAIVSFGRQGDDRSVNLYDASYDTTTNVSLTHFQDPTVLENLSTVDYRTPGTCVMCGIRMGNRQLNNPERQSVLILLSDGQANRNWDGSTNWNSAYPRSPSEKAIAEASKAGVEYRVVGYGERALVPSGTSDIDEVTLKAIAHNIEGNYTYASDPSVFQSAFRKIIADVCR